MQYTFSMWQRKKEYITDLEERTNGLITENHDLIQKIAKLSTLNVEFKLHIDSLEKSLNETKSENNHLKSRLATSTSSSPTSTATTPDTNNEEDTHMASPTTSPTTVKNEPSSIP